jgi:hypothetical protein
MRNRFLGTAGAILGATLLVSAPLYAQEATGTGGGVAETNPADGTGGKRSPGSIKSAPTIQELEEMVIEGKIQKPEVFYILGRGETHYKMPILKESFVERIERSVEKNPF